MMTLGIDIGSITAKAAVMRDGKILAVRILRTGYNAKNAGDQLFEGIVSGLGLNPSDIQGIVATGYGRKSITFADRAVTEITCHAAGARYMTRDLLAEIRTVIDIGGQDSKVILLDETGRVKDFAMNDKCAAGTGRFLEVMARALDVEISDFGSLSLSADHPASISSLCTVFAESEVISLISKGESRKNIIAGIHDSIAARVSAMAGRIRWIPPVMMTGGVAQNSGVVRSLEKKIGYSLIVTPNAQLAGAIGAALIAMNK
ncbi:MAG: acyl-CoA dehydratase activase [Pseudomonadota bacterium]